MEDSKYLLLIFRRYPDSIVADYKFPLIPVLLPSFNRYYQRAPAVTKLDRVAKEVLEQLHEHRMNSLHRRQLIAADHCIAFTYGHLQMPKRLLYRDVAVDILKTNFLYTQSRIGQQIADEPAHSVGSVYGEAYVLLSLGIKLFTIALFEQL